MAVIASERPSKVVIMALEEFCHGVDVRCFLDHLRKMIFAYLQADEDASLYDYSRQLWGELDELFDFLAVLGDMQEARRVRES